MKNRTPVPRDQRPPLAPFEPVPRKCRRHDGWTPERQRAFIDALAGTGSVTVAARTVNMSTESAYALRAHPAGAGFRAAWHAALDMGVERLHDEAMERALNGQLVPVFAGGKLMGYRRKKNDRLLMFVLRHHRFDAGGRRVTVNMFQANATATCNGPADARPAAHGNATAIGAALPQGIGPDLAQLALPAPAPDLDKAARTIADFATVPLDDAAQAQIVAALEANAARQRALPPEDDPQVPYVGAAEAGPYCGELEIGAESLDHEPFRRGEPSWQMLDDQDALERIDRAVAEVEAQAASAPPAPAAPPASPRHTGGAAAAALPPYDEAYHLDRIDALVEAAKAEVVRERAEIDAAYSKRPGRTRKR